MDIGKDAAIPGVMYKTRHRRVLCVERSRAFGGYGVRRLSTRQTLALFVWGLALTRVVDSGLNSCEIGIESTILCYYRLEKKILITYLNHIFLFYNYLSVSLN